MGGREVPAGPRDPLRAAIIAADELAAVDAARGSCARAWSLLAFPSAVIAGWGLISPRSLLRQPSRARAGTGSRRCRPTTSTCSAISRAASLAIVVFLVGAAIVLERRTIQIALIAFLAYSVPHFAYHLTTTEHYSTGDNVGSLGGFVVTIVLAGPCSR